MIPRAEGLSSHLHPASASFSSHSSSRRWLLVFVLILLAAPATVLSLYDSVARIGRPFQGFLFLGNGYVYFSGLRSWTGRLADLQRWDRITHVAGRPVSSLPRELFQEKIELAHTLGEPLVYVVRRGDQDRSIAITPMALSVRDWFLSIGPLPWVAVIYLLLGFVLYVRGRHLQVALPFFIFTYGIGAAFIGLYDLTLGHRFERLSSMLFIPLFPLGVAIGTLHVPFPLFRESARRGRWLALAGAISLAFSLGMGLTMERGGIPYRVAGTGITLTCLLALVGLGVAGLHKWRHPPTPLDRQRAKALNIGGWVAFAPILLALLLMTVFNVEVPLGPFLLFAIVYPIAIGFSIIRYNLFTMDRLLSQALSYTLTSVPAGLIYGGNLVVLFWLSDKIGFLYALVFAWLIFLLTLILVNPLQSRLSRWIARRLGADYSYQKAIQDVSAGLTQLLDVRAILSQVLKTLVRYMNLTHGVFMLPSGKDGDFRTVLTEGDPPADAAEGALMGDTELVRLLKDMRRELTTYEILESPSLRGFCPSCIPALQSLRATVTVPILFQEEVKGLLILGSKRDGTHFTDEDMNVLRTIANQTAVSLENALSYQTIKVLNLNLEEKVQQRTLELEEALQEKERTQEELVRSQSLAAIGQLVAGVAHEINNPLASAYSLIQSIVEEMEGRDAIGGDSVTAMRDDLRFILKEQQRARDIIRSLLDLSRQSDNYAEPIRLNEVVEDALRVLYNKYKNSDLHITKHLDADLPTVMGNFSQLGQVAINIIQNAIQAVPEQGGAIEVATHWIQGDGHAPSVPPPATGPFRAEDPTERRGVAGGGMVAFSCKDNGSGIPKSAVMDIFKPFYTTKPAGQGTGLGLYICHQIVSKHKGAIRVESEPGAGTTFYVDIPAPTAT